MPVTSDFTASLPALDDATSLKWQNVETFLIDKEQEEKYDVTTRFYRSAYDKSCCAAMRRLNLDILKLPEDLLNTTFMVFSAKHLIN